MRLEIQELNWQRCKRIYDVLLVIAIFIVVLVHLLFLIDILRAKVKRAYQKQTHLQIEEELDVKQKPNSMVAMTSLSPTDRTSTTTSSTAEDRQFPKGMTQEDYIDFERYERFIYAHARDL